MNSSRSLLSLVFCALAVSVAGAFAAGHPLDSWTPVTLPDSAIRSPNDAIFVNGEYWAVGGTGRVQHSLNTTDWQVVQTPASGHIVSIAFGNGRYVATGYYMTIMSSPNGIDWTVHLEDLNEGFDVYRQVIFANGKFLAIGTGGAVQISTDGVDWTPATMALPSTNHYPQGVAWGNGLYVAALDSWNSFAIMTSPDGVEWTEQSIGSSSERFEAIAYGNGMFVATGWNQAVYSSPDGVEWTKRDVVFQYSSSRIWDVKFINSHFVGYGQAGGLFTSPDGIEWTTRTFPQSDISAVVYNHDRLLAFRTFSDPRLSDPWAPVGVDDPNDPVDPIDPNASAQIANISTRAWVGTGDTKLITGFVVNGTSAKQLLIRGVGPTLGGYGVGGTLVDPMITLYDSANHEIATNNDWGTFADQATLAAETAKVFAFPLNAGSKDAAMVITLQPGSYTLHTAGADAGTGVALAEVYDCATGAACKLVNISSRGFIGLGDSVAIPGFIVAGNKPKKLLVRGVGPTLGDFGVPATIADPKITLYDAAQAVVASNDNWTAYSDQPGLAAATAQVFAFPLKAGSTDAAMIVTVNPGSYTAVVSGNDNGIGVALVEVYEIE